jgi:outer membrane protein assembly factor BamB
VVWEDSIYLTCYSGYGVDADNPGDIANLKLHLVCLARNGGKIRWDRAIPATQPEAEYRSFIPEHGYASSTPVTDGKAVYVFFGRSGVHAFTMDGKPIWTADVGTKTHEWGSASSAILYRDLVLVNASVESDSVVALDKATGKEVWRCEGVLRCWATPLVVQSATGRDELVLAMQVATPGGDKRKLQGKVLSLDPATGKKLWECDGINDYVCAMVTAADDVVFATAGKTQETIAIRLGGEGNVTKSHVLWRVKEGSKVGTPVAANGRLSWVDFRGVALCLDAKTGKTLYKENLSLKGPNHKVYASPVLAGGKLYCVTRQDGTVVLAEGAEFRELGRNRLDDNSLFNATPAVSGNQLLIRSNRFLYCIGK